MFKKIPDIRILFFRAIKYFKKLDNIGIVWWFFVIFMAILVITLFKFTIIRNDYYTNLANFQQKTIVQNPISRGSIISSESSNKWVVAISTNLWKLAIDPTQTGSVDGLLDFLTDTVVLQFCGNNYISNDCKEDIWIYVKEWFSTTITESELKSKIRNYLKNKMQTPIESVLVAENLNEETIEKINNLNEKSLFFVINNLYVNPTLVGNKEILAEKLITILDIKKENLLSKFEIRQKRYMEVIRKMNVLTNDYVKNFSEKNKKFVFEKISQELSKVESHQKNAVRDKIMLENAVYNFLIIEPSLMRYYPEWESLGQITGFVDALWVGRYGIEGYFENILQGWSPTQLVTKDVRWRYIDNYTKEELLNLQNGSTIELTIDRNVQKEVAKKLENAVKKFQANRGSVIITDPKTGAIISMVNYPTYDPNNFTDVYELEPIVYSEYPDPLNNLFGQPMFVIDTENGNISTNIDGKRVKIREATESEISNFAIQKFKYKNGYGIGNYQNSIISSIYEPGSVFKPITVAIGLDTGEIKPNDTYYDKNYVELDFGSGIKQRIWNLSKTKCGGTHTYQNSLNWSCNVWMINIVEKVGRALFDSYIRNFGFNEKTGITLDWEVSTQIESYEKWARSKFFNMSFGQGISVTMIQMAAAYNALANGGIYMKPYIVESIVNPDGKEIKAIPTQLRRVIKEETSKTITAMMVDGVKNWYAAAGWVAGYTMAGKTGTSQIPYKWTYANLYFGRENGHTLTSYGWYAPAYNPKFVMIVAIERPRTSAHSEQTSAVLYQEIASYLLNYYKVPKWQQ